MNNQNEKLNQVLTELERKIDEAKELGNGEFNEGYIDGLRTSISLLAEKLLLISDN